MARVRSPTAWEGENGAYSSKVVGVTLSASYQSRKKGLQEVMSAAQGPAWRACEIGKRAPGWTSSISLSGFRVSGCVVGSVSSLVWTDDLKTGQSNHRPERIFLKFWLCVLISDEFSLCFPSFSQAIFLPPPPKFWGYSYALQRGLGNCCQTPHPLLKFFRHLTLLTYTKIPV